MKRLLVSDLDGTFLENNGTIPDFADSFRDALLCNEIELVFATSRPPGDPLVNKLKQKYTDWIICNDGSIAYYCGDSESEIIIENSLPYSVVKRNLDFFYSIGVSPILFMNSLENFDVYIPDSMNIEMEEQLKQSDTTRKLYRYANESEVNIKNIRAITLFGNIGSDISEKVTGLNRGIANVYYYKETRFGKNMWLDVSAIDANKYSTATKIADLLFIRGVDIALGNGLNDLQMMTSAHWSACPITAMRDVADIANYRSPAIEGNDFLKDVIRELGYKKWLT